RRRHTRSKRDWSSDVCSSDLPYVLFIRRMVILAIVGALHQLINPGEALLVYALMGIPVVFLDKIPKKFNLMLGIAGIILGSYIGNKTLITLPLMILGVAFGQYRVFESYLKNRKKWMMVAVLSFAVTSVIVVFLWQKAPSDGLITQMEGYELTEAQIETNIAFYDFADLALVFAPFLSVFYVSFLVLIEPLIGKGLTPLNAFGRMAFTNYIGQSVILVVLLLFIPNDKVVCYVVALFACLPVVVPQLIDSTLWLKYFKYGSLEWIWRCGTYGKWLPILK